MKLLLKSIEGNILKELGNLAFGLRLIQHKIHLHTEKTRYNYILYFT